MHALAIEAHGLTKRFGKALALDGLELAIERGQTLALLGPADAGKSVALRLFAGLARPSGGSAMLLGAASGSRAGLAARRKLGYLAQGPAFYGWMTGRALLTYATSLLGMDRGRVTDAVAQAIDHVGLESMADRRTAEYTLAQRQRLGIAQALLGEPEVVLLDEPLGWSDPDAEHDLLAALDRLSGTATIVIATTDLALAERACERVAVLDGGHVLATGETSDLLGRVATWEYLVTTAPASGLAMAGLLARLAGEPWVAAVEPSDGALHVSVLDEVRAERELAPAIVGTGLRIIELRRQRPSVEVLVERLRGGTS